MTDARVRADIGEELDRRREEISRVRLVCGNEKGTILEGTAAAMAIPMVYAHWEGFVKAALERFVLHLDSRRILQREACSEILAHSWTKTFSRLSGDLRFEKQVEFAELLIGMLGNATLEFRKEQKEIDTKSNLSFGVLSDLAMRLAFSVKKIEARKADVDRLVRRRNDIAHGKRGPSVAIRDVDEYCKMVVELMEEVEAALGDALTEKSFLRDEFRRRA